MEANISGNCIGLHNRQSVSSTPALHGSVPQKISKVLQMLIMVECTACCNKLFMHSYNV